MELWSVEMPLPGAVRGTVPGAVSRYRTVERGVGAPRRSLSSAAGTSLCVRCATKERTAGKKAALAAFASSRLHVACLLG